MHRGSIGFQDLCCLLDDPLETIFAGIKYLVARRVSSEPGSVGSTVIGQTKKHKRMKYLHCYVQKPMPSVDGSE